MTDGSEGEDAGTLEFTPTWVVALVCTVIVGISLAVERLLHYTGKVTIFFLFFLFLFLFLQNVCLFFKKKLCIIYVQYLKKKNQKPLYEALLKVKEGALYYLYLFIALFSFMC